MLLSFKVPGRSRGREHVIWKLKLGDWGGKGLHIDGGGEGESWGGWRRTVKTQEVPKSHN